ncbi:hypothetical protein K1719_035585 [Acacia pycnantha]|nr:hypothetical protein K1719_035582 [Acacia pycnantha]KAI9082442.1 hypothetical protein K1719_035585 [Acacia pycnantha]
MASPSAFSGDVVFAVRRRQPELVAPAKPTPRELKLLSDVDDQQGLRFQIPFMHFYGHEASMKGKDPAQVIKKALSQALVFYYPFAGRLREGPGRKLMVDCNEEGVIFIEADVDITLQQFGDILQPPFPYFDELLYKVPGSEGVINCPLLIIQVTRLKCGGFIFAYRLNHTMSDGAGIVQFLNAVAEIAGGACEPSIAPVWRRELLSARDPPRITCTHLRTQRGAAVTTAGKLCENSLGFALELVKKAKAEATTEYIQSLADLMVIKGRPCFIMPGTWFVSDTSRLGFRDVDFGWGKSVYGGPATAGAGPFPGVSYFVGCENAKREEGIVVPFYLPFNALKRFVQELDQVLGQL